MGLNKYTVDFTSTYEVRVTDLETCRTVTEIITGRTIEELNEKLQKAYNKCTIEIVHGLKNDK